VKFSIQRTELWKEVHQAGGSHSAQDGLLHVCKGVIPSKTRGEEREWEESEGRRYLKE
jgi:hypothetical protein